MKDKDKLDLIDEIILKVWDVSAGDPASWTGFLEGTLTAIQVITEFVSEEEEQSDER